VCMNINTLSRHCEYLVSGQSRLWSTVSRCKVFFGAWKRDMLWVFTRTFKAPRNAAQHLSIIPKDLVGPCGTREMTEQSLIVPISASFFFLLSSFFFLLSSFFSTLALGRSAHMISLDSWTAVTPYRPSFGFERSNKWPRTKSMDIHDAGRASLGYRQNLGIVFAM